MSKIPVISGKKLMKLLEKIGYYLDYQSGSHLILRQSDYPFRRITVPNHKEVAKGTLKKILRDCGISLNEFLELLGK